MTDPSGIIARRAAVQALDAILADALLMSELADLFAPLSAQDRARAQRLALTTLRELGRADRVLKGFLRKTPDLTVMNVLRVATVELCSLNAASHGVVNAAVQLVASNRKAAHAKGLVNAVLRKVSEAGPDQWGKLATPQLPKWLRQPLIAAYGNSVVQKIEGAHLRPVPLDISVKNDPAQAVDALNGTVLPTGTVRLTNYGQVSKLPGFAEGDWWVQDAAAALPAKILQPQKGEHILDMCAAPGGKTLQLAALGANVVALDRSEARLQRLHENLQRCQLTAEVVVGDALDHAGQFDAILLDAPCSATGTIRRHPDLPHAKDGSDFSDLIDLQAQMLDHAVTLLKPGGRLVYCTCSLLPDEGECQIDDLLLRHPQIIVDKSALTLPGVDPDWITQEGGLRLRPDYWPEQGGMDGFYIACLRNPA
ncbi:RsmB/NOP family class I SAM-dependent RNA methyltransferase [Pseudaestuariivita rosea]|uniref:RsmB/NOP family class I SAM-dependent RNA methyltransferase n=1 Tax=Pseudaestuariivita rosea TaxID=2763263 RepID=UPI001ABAB5B9|nr:RsmB/NOP family class I SAM-dependent RNA methyltransferase [Pseudaestuariivita rosea]